ncbi:Phosphoglycolate phosphatase [Planctomycetes bacterium Poly30]|uniref:Phosphoglycolate phosphatase n=1 Tax=Saltatorellus ferox TaxID=2528018 RepID=A0A518EKE2_9BACT|nr:Phosphoglycolate phosphatase [Planctomycetes bacterium Poly30]
MGFDPSHQDVRWGAYRGVIFDLDGTLTQPGAIDFVRMRERIGMEASGSILAWIDENATNESEAESMRAVVWEEESLALDRMALGDGLSDLVAYLMGEGAGLHTAICTRNSADAIEVFDARLRSAGFPRCATLFHVSVARDQYSDRIGRVIRNKPSPEPTHEIKHAWGVVDRYPLHVAHESEEPRYPDLLFVGDDIDDLLAGRRAGTAAGWMQHGRAEVPACATHTFTCLADCARALRAMED